MKLLLVILAASAASGCMSAVRVTPASAEMIHESTKVTIKNGPPAPPPEATREVLKLRVVDREVRKP